MKAIFDKISSPKEFPLSELLAAVQNALLNSQIEPVIIRKLGGVGSGIWDHEFQLDEGNKVIITFSDLQMLAESAENNIDELWATMGKIHFGISDASFLFVQCDDKETESTIARQFNSIREIPDISAPE